MGSKLFFQLYCCVFALLLATVPAYSQSPPSLTLGTAGDGARNAVQTINDGGIRIASWNSELRALRVYEWRNGGWTEQSVATAVADCGGIAFLQPTLVAASSSPQFVFTDTTNRTLYVASKVASQWQLEIVDPGRAVVGKPGIARCGNEICVSYYDATSGDLRVARKGTGSWQYRVADASADDVGMTSVADTLPSGRMVIGYSNRTTRSIRVASEGATNFSIEEVRHGSDPLAMTLDLATDAVGQIHIAYSHYNPGVPSELGLYYGRRDLAGGWASGSVRRSYTGGSAAILLDANGWPTVLGRFNRPGSARSFVRSGTLTASGLWNTARFSPGDTLESPTQEFREIHAARTLDGRAVIVYGFLDQSATPRLYVHTDAGAVDDGYAPSPRGGDSDGDGIADEDEYFYGTDPNRADTDGDGVADGDEIFEGTDPNDRGVYNAGLLQHACAPWERIGSSPRMTMQVENIGMSAIRGTVSVYDSRGKRLGRGSCAIGAGRLCRADIAKMIGKSGGSYGSACFSHNGTRGAVRGNVKSEDAAPKKGTPKAPVTQFLSSGVLGQHLVPMRQISRRVGTKSQSTASTVVLTNLTPRTVGGQLELLDGRGGPLALRRINLSPNGSARIPMRVRSIGSVRWTPMSGARTLLTVRREEMLSNAKSRYALTRSALQGVAPRGGEVSLSWSGASRSELLVVNGKPWPIQTTVDAYDTEGRLLETFRIALLGRGTEAIALTGRFGGVRRVRLAISSAEREAFAATILSETVARGVSRAVRFSSGTDARPRMVLEGVTLRSGKPTLSVTNLEDVESEFSMLVVPMRAVSVAGPGAVKVLPTRLSVRRSMILGVPPRATRYVKFDVSDVHRVTVVLNKSRSESFVAELFETSPDETILQTLHE